MKPIRWILVALAVIGFAGLVYWLTRPTTSKKSITSTDLTGLTSLLSSSTLTSSNNSNGSGGGSITPVNNSDDDDEQTPTNIPNWTVGDYGAETGTDYQGNPFVRSAAPTIPFEAKVKPYTHGVNYTFAEQTVKGVALFKRFPEFNLVDVKIHSMGPWYSVSSANAHFTRGVETITALPNFRTGPQSVVNLPSTRKNSMLQDPVFWAAAGILAAQVGSSDPKYAALNALATNHELVLNQAAYVALGRAVWSSEKNVTDVQGQGTRYMSLDIEDSTPYNNFRQIVGWLYMGYCQAALDAGITVIPFTYYGPEQVVIDGLSGRQFGGTGNPEYLSADWDFLANSADPTIQAIAQFGGVFANDTYIQAIWGNEPMLARNSSGVPQLDNDGLPIFSTLSQTIAYGQTIPLESGEAQMCLRDLYEQSARLYLMNHRAAGAYPSHSGMRRAGLETAQLGSFTRYTNEGVDGITHNDRPVPAWELELFSGLNMFLTSHLWCWSSDFNQVPDVLGSNHASTWQYQAHGVAESITKAAHRHSAFGTIQNTAFKWCWFNLAFVNYMHTDGDRYHQKAICHGKIRNVSGIVWLEVFLAFPATDNRSTLFQLWVKQGSVQSAAYQCELPSGRHYFYDAFQLPSTFAYDQLEGENVYLAYPDALDVQRIHRGDYRATVGRPTMPQPA